ncbi:hypothetical protein CYMTET_8717 [Cymbomonas tetramitiformis]|uniref:Uncharacterized protein n=1 Tax=Cymbomonas tetramitiformis TaxID=36881 RepID=A0AAE0LG74_9CHLO|nr:hypothetical protein CYMTET_8717 [Cymbomonas tetramitiformis]
MKRYSALEVNRATWLTKQVSLSYFSKLKSTLLELGIMVSTGGDRYSVDLSRIITSDEAPNPLSATLAGHYGNVICGVGQKCNKVKVINKERISLDVYVGMDGTWYDPHLILGSKTVFENQIPAMQRDMDVLISTQANAFQDNSTLLSALQHLDKQLTQRRVKKPVLWLTDGQSARFNLKVPDFAEENELVEFVYPPHTTTAHALLDRVFHMWHNTYSKSVDDWSKANPGKSVTKAVFAAVFPGAWEKWTRSIHVQRVALKPEATGVYLGSPSIVRCPLNGNLIASHDYFGDIDDQRATQFNTSIFVSDDEGVSWKFTTNVTGTYWSNLWEHKGFVYLMGTAGDNLGADEGKPGVTLAYSSDGVTWSAVETVLNATQQNVYHTAPTPVVESEGVLYRGMETWAGSQYVNGYNALMMSAKSDCLSSQTQARTWCWRKSNILEFDEGWVPHAWKVYSLDLHWQESNAVVGPNGEVYLILRVDGQQTACFNKAAVARYTPSTNKLRFEKFIDFPSSSTKFVIRRDPATKRYFALTNPVTGPTPNTESQRNVLVLATSDDLMEWKVCGEPLLHDDTGFDWTDSLRFTGFQYVDWQFDGLDIIAAVRSGYRGANSFHNANRVTFLRIPHFATRQCETGPNDWITIYPEPSSNEVWLQGNRAFSQAYSQAEARACPWPQKKTSAQNASYARCSARTLYPDYFY